MEHQPLTYQQLLSTHYEQSARDVLISQQEYDDTHVDSNETQAGMPLEHPEDFNKFGGSRGDQDLVVKHREFEDKGKGSIRYSKDVATNIFAVDSRFRSYAVPGIPALPSTLTQNTSTVNRIMVNLTEVSR